MIRRLWAPVALALAVVAVDLVTKRHAAISYEGSPVWLIDGFFGFTYVENPGAAFGMFRNGGVLVGIAALIISVVVLVAITRPRPTLERLALGFLLGGAVGNLVDRFARGDGIIDGAVIDWINLWVIPTFNVADVSVNVAVALLLVEAWRKR